METWRRSDPNSQSDSSDVERAGLAISLRNSGMASAMTSAVSTGCALGGRVLPRLALLSLTSVPGRLSRCLVPLDEVPNNISNGSEAVTSVAIPSNLSHSLGRGRNHSSQDSALIILDGCITAGSADVTDQSTCSTAGIVELAVLAKMSSLSTGIAETSRTRSRSSLIGRRRN